MTRRTIRTAAACSALALATALVAAPAAAQSFQGNSTVVFGSATVTTATNTTDVQVDSTSAVIDWAPFDTATSPGAPILFQPAGTTATFHNNPTSQNDFAVLNRIVPVDASRPIVFDGTVVSRLQTFAGQVPGGTVFFYSPGGIIVGANAVFDVGNLGLTTAPPAVDANGNWYTGNQVQFEQAASGSFVDIQPGAQIIASAENSYIAVFAPYVVQNGNIDVNGQAALVAGEAGTITFSPDGLFDIQVSIGTDGQGGAGIVHGGTTTGPASSGTGDNHRIYMVAAPKNTLLSLALLGGSQVGFDVAGAADVVGNAVVLSAGFDVFGGQTIIGTGNSPARADILVQNTEVTSEFTATATGATQIQALGGGATSFAANLTARGGNFAQVFAQGIGSSVSVAGTASVSSINDGFLLPEGADAFSGNVDIFATGGAIISVGGDLFVTTDSQGAGSETAGVASGDGNAGQIIFQASNGSTIEVGGNAILSAQGLGGPVFASGVAGGAGNGGSIFVYAEGANSTLEIGGNLELLALGIGASTPDATLGGAGNGGFAFINANLNGAINVGGVTRAKTHGVGGNGAAGMGGDSIMILESGGTLTTVELNLSADGIGGSDTGAGAGDGTGGTALIGAQGAGTTLTVLNGNSTGNPAFGELEMLSAEGFGGATSGGGSGIGGTGTGGIAQINATDQATVALPQDLGTFGRLAIRAIGIGGNALADGTTGGLGVGGDASIFLDNSTLTAADLVPAAFGQGGFADPILTGVVNGGDGIGGNRSIILQNGASLTAAFPGGTSGGIGGNGSALGAGGDGSGGSASLFIDNATLNVVAAIGAFNSDFIVVNQTVGGTGATGGDASGGSAHVIIQNGGVLDASGAGLITTIGANAFAGDALAPGAIAGGSATAGNTHVVVQNGTLLASELNIVATAFGGSVSEGLAGSGTGGSAHLQLIGATINADSIVVEAGGVGGSADPALAGSTTTPGPGTGGAGTGGFALISADGGANSITAGTVSIVGDAIGGSASGPGGDGGAALGGESRLAVTGGSTLDLTGTVSVTSVAQAGDSLAGNGGDAFGGIAHVFAGGGGTLNLVGDLTIDGSSFGGAGINGGSATNDPDAIEAEVLLFAIDGTITVSGSAELRGDATGGAGSQGGAGGAAQAGNFVVRAATSPDGPSTITLADVFGSASARGGAGGDSTSGAGGAGGLAFGGFAGILGTAGSGTLTINGTSTLEANATGGTGGDGTTGGAGGSAVGGVSQFGTISGPVTTENTGSARFVGDVSAVGAGIGGDGGAGSSGAGGAGGDGTNGAAVLLVRGSPVTIDGTAQLTASGIGGNGGVGATGDGAGGDGIVGNAGGIAVIASNRFEVPEDRGTLNANTIIGQAFAAGGTGSTPGAALVGETPALFRFDSADGTIGTLDFSVSGTQIIGTVPDAILLTDATVDVGDFSFVTPTDLLLALDSAVLSTNLFLLQAREIVLPETAPTVPGTVVATSGLQIFVDSGSSIRTFTNFETAFGVDFTVDGDFQTGDFTADGDILISALNGSVTTGDLNSGGSINLTAGADILTGAILAAGSSFLDAQGILSVGAVQTGGGFSTFVGGSQTIGDVLAGGTVDIRSRANGAITVGTITGQASVYVITNGGAVTTGNITATNAAPDGRTFGIGLRGGSINTADLSTPGSIAISAETTDLLVGNVNSGGTVLALAAGSVSTGAISAGTDPGETVYIGNVSDLSRLGPNDDFSQVIAFPPAPVGGTITLGGPVSTDAFLAASTGAFTAGAITSLTFVDVSSGGLVSVNGAWQSPSIGISANDIAIASTGSLMASPGGVFLLSTNPNGMFIGDGTAGGGFVLDNAEFGRITAGDVEIGTVDTANPIDMTVGDLSISASRIGGADAESGVSFFISDEASESSGGGIRVNGNVLATGFGEELEIEFDAALFELNAATGSVVISGSTSGSLAGEIEIEANHIHVASDEILLRLRADPFYEGRAADLNRPADVQRPDGVLRALGLDLTPGQTVYVQNTGTARNPAGFYTTIENSEIHSGSEDPSAPPVDAIINGRVQTASGDVTGRDAFDLIVAEAEVSLSFTDTSQINSCTISTSVCSNITDPPPPTNTAEIEVLTEDQAEEEPFETEEEDEAEDDASSPITPPVVLINSRPLNPEVDVTDPVSGTGNPALIDATLSDDAQGDQQ